DASLRHVFAGAANFQVVLSAALRHALELHRAKAGAEGGFRAGWNKQRDAFEKHLRLWTEAALRTAIEVLESALTQTRREPGLGHSLAEQALWEVAELRGARLPN
ncbi:MAG: DNA polymerase III subunit delta, partial [Methylocapsa sp.]|nr:DNA polymerase III subunit delta [Methylocapsa sp.]